MSRLRWGTASALLVFVLLFAVAACTPSGAKTQGGAQTTTAFAATAQATSIPREAIETYQYAKANSWKARDGYVGNREFENREGQLPKDGTYLEYDIHPTKPGVNRGPERIVIDTKTGKAWYTSTHYGDAGEPPFVEIPGT
jgi:guanyl-specific ribonuclease Sa